MFLIDVMSKTPVYMQIVEQVERFILSGVLRPGEQIPSVRNLSTELSINPNTIQKAYTELDRLGIIYSVPGKGCFITKEARDILISSKSGLLDELNAIVKELKLAGIEKEKIIDCIERSYKND